MSLEIQNSLLTKERVCSKCSSISNEEAIFCSICGQQFPINNQSPVQPSSEQKEGETSHDHHEQEYNNDINNDDNYAPVTGLFIFSFFHLKPDNLRRPLSCGKYMKYCLFISILLIIGGVIVGIFVMPGLVGVGHGEDDPYICTEIDECSGDDICCMTNGLSPGYCQSPDDICCNEDGYSCSSNDDCCDTKTCCMLTGKCIDEEYDVCCSKGSCESASDCCVDAYDNNAHSTCIDNMCGQCSETNGYCKSNSDCCSGLYCGVHSAAGGSYCGDCAHAGSYCGWKPCCPGYCCGTDDYCKSC